MLYGTILGVSIGYGANRFEIDQDKGISKVIKRSIRLSDFA